MLSPTEEIKSKLDIVDVIQEYVPLKQSGVNLKGLCPFHNEKTPSFMVSREKQFFKCFGCGEGGDIFTFLQKIEGLEFPEALKILADRAGVELQAFRANPEFNNLKTRLYELHTLVVKFFQDNLFNSPAGKSAREYLVNIRKLDKDILDKFKIGYALDSWDAVSKFLRAKGFTDNEIKSSGLVVEKDKAGPDGKNYYDRFRNRIMFPIADHHGNIVGFTARAMSSEEAAKYINTPQTIIYNKSQVLYGLDKAKEQIRKLKFVILVEGNMDVIASHKAGVENIVCSSGTSLTEDQIKILKRYTTNIVIAFDTDAAGILAAERGVSLLWQNEMNVKAVSLPENVKDPDELVQKNPSDWKKVINKKINFLDFLIEHLTKNKDLQNIDNKKKISTALLPWLAKTTNSVERDHYLKKLAGLLDIEFSALSIELEKIIARLAKFLPPATLTKSEPTQITPQINRYKILSERLLALALNSTEYLEETIQKISPEFIFQELQPIYNEAILYYTKNNKYDADEFYNSLAKSAKNLVFLFDNLKLMFANELAEMTKRELAHEFDLIVNSLKKDKISEQLKQIEIQMRSAEKSGNRELSNELMKKFSELSQELKNI